MFALHSVMFHWSGSSSGHPESGWEGVVYEDAKIIINVHGEPATEAYKSWFRTHRKNRRRVDMIDEFQGI